MASSNRQQKTPLTAIIENSKITEFLQLVRVLLRTMPKDYQLSFRVSPNLAFPTGEIADCQLDHEQKKITIVTQFMGLIGQSGIMPLHYTEHLLARLHAKDTTLLAFLDIFHQQILQLFYEVSTLSHFYLASERGQSHPVSELLSALGGHSRYLPSDIKKYYAGILQLPTRTASGLQQLLKMYFALPITVIPQQPKLVCLTLNDVTQLTRTNTNRQLGRNALLGKKLWDVQSRFAVRIGSIDYPTFLSILSDQYFLNMIEQMIRDYTHRELEHDIQFLINSETLPPCRLSRTNESKLGWNTRLTRKYQSLEPICIKFKTRAKTLKNFMHC